MIKYLYVFIILFIIEWIYLKIATSKKIIDKPNHRSAHTSPAVLGGGIVIILSLLIYTVVNYPLKDDLFVLVTGSALVATISFIDDVVILSSKIRILVHIIVISLLFISFFITGSIPFIQILILAFLFVFSLGFINIYNFMDGINGITFLNALVSYLTLYYINEYYLLFTDSEVLLYLIIAVLVFGIFNFRKKAVCFCGDVGSITIGFTLLFFVLLFYSKTKDPILFFLFSVYLIDGGGTLLQRILNKENIFKAHKKHLYQKLVNENKINHLLISSLYFILQLLINVLIIAVLIHNLNIYILYSVVFFYSIIYFIVRKKRILMT